MNNKINELIEKEIQKLDSQAYNYQKFSIQFNLVELRKTLFDEGEFPNEQELFLDIKKLVGYYINSVDESYYGYYEIAKSNSDKVLEKISYLQLEKQIYLIETMQRKLKLAGFTDQAEYFDDKVDSIRLKKFVQKWHFKNLFKIINILAARNFLSLLVSIFFVYLIYSLLLLPAPVSWMEFFTINYSDCSSNRVLNHFLNTMLSFSQIDSDFSIEPKGIVGVLLLIIIKVSILVLLFNFFMSQFKKKLNLL